MSADPPGSPTSHERFRLWITGVEVTPENSDPNCSFSARMFIDHELGCNLPTIDSTGSLRWSGLFHCNVSPTSTVAIRLCRSTAGRSRYFNFPAFVVSEVDEETGEVTLELAEAAWVVTIKLLTSATVWYLFPDELEKLDTIERAYNCLPTDSNETAKYLFKHALKFANLAVQALPECTAKVSFLIYMKAWELLDQQTRLDDTIQAILRGLTGIRDIVDIAGQASDGMLAAAMSRSKESIYGILTLLEDASVYIFNRLSTNHLAPVSLEEAGTDQSFGVETYLSRLKELQTQFHASWSPMAATPMDIASTDDDELSDAPQQGFHTSTTIDPYDMLRLLRPLDPNGYDPRQACVDGTRDMILTRIITWTQNRESTEGLMWISGQAGMGKTAIATSLCQRLDGIRALAGSFFCQRGDLDTSDPLRLINNLVHELAMWCPAYAQEVAYAIRANRRLCNSHLDLRYNGLIKKPLERLESLSMRVNLVIVIDALDECGDSESRKQILDHLHEMTQIVPWMKIVITARPISDIHDYFTEKCPREPVPQLEDHDATSAIRTYIEDQVTNLAEKDHWPLDSIDQLCSMSGGVFLWATLAVRYIKKSAFPSLPRLRKVLSKQKSPVTDQFDALYTKALEMAIDDEEDEIKAAYLQCIGAILAISEREPLATPDLHYLLLVVGQIDQLTVDQTIKSLSPLLLMTDGRCIRFFHPSFKDFITNATRSGRFHIRLDQYEAEPAACCLQVMQRDLCFNICKLETSHHVNKDIPDLKQRIDTHIGPVLQYACMHWIDHFIASPTQGLVKAIHKFMEGPQLMYWIEALSLLGRIDVAIEGLFKLVAVDLLRFSESGQVVSWATDARRFILSFYDPITTSTPHLYVSALAFAPRDCLTAARMRPHFPNIITVAQGGDARWHPCMKVIIHIHGIQTLSISPDGKHIVAGYPDGSLAMWDKQTGACVSKSPVDHLGMVTCIMYSPDGNLVASSSHDATIHVWDVTNGLQHNRVLSGHSGPVHSVAFSPNSSLIASGSSDRTIRLWDPNTAHPIHEPYVGHSSRVTSVAFSPDGTKLVSGSWDSTIRVWSVDIGTSRLANNPLVITGHSDSVTCISFSPDGSKIASGSMDQSIQIWDAQTGVKSELRASPAKHSDTVTASAFSPNGKLIASCSLDGTIQLWGDSTFAYSEPFGHSSPVNAVTFSPDGCHLVSGSSDMTTRVWEVDACPKPMMMEPLAGHSDRVRSIAVTRGGARIVSASEDKTVRIWDAQTGAPVGDPLTGHSNCVLSVAVSPDGTHIVSGGQDKLLKLWDIATHANIQSYEHSSPIRCAAFSPNGAQIVFGADNNNVYLWDITGWKMIKQGLQGHSGRVWSVAFSPDGTCLASASADKTVMLWDIASHSRIGSLYTGHTDQVLSVAFSPCGTQLVSGSCDRTVRVWDRQMGNTIHTLTGHGHYVWAVAFSPDRSCIASSDDKTIRLWNVNTGQPIGQPFTEHSGIVFSIAFSSDGNYLISGSGDTTIRVQNIATSYPPAEPETELPDAFRWPSNPYEMTSHPEHPGWVTHDHQYDFWLPAHYEQPEKFHHPSLRARPPAFLNYSKFVHGTEWTKVECESAGNNSQQ
ncbi:vegetative incompatibility protein HET-E-1 [Rhizoctonia solani 123E]|uniref:Vegetative incompatibility protein HET-E-1 n=1 Tax=Rhizoctonia solani 123E TaxID=1423351 RepID=A0A074SE27_9AGAM|nr:vegetative incompatibility protein HET-E-1 [Rhizoctonia solani 123E]